MSNPKLDECVAMFEVSVRRFAPELLDTLEAWKSNPCYDFALLLSAYLENLLSRLNEALDALEVIYV